MHTAATRLHSIMHCSLWFRIDTSGHKHFVFLSSILTFKYIPVSIAIRGTVHVWSQRHLIIIFRDEVCCRSSSRSLFEYSLFSDYSVCTMAYLLSSKQQILTRPLKETPRMAPLIVRALQQGRTSVQAHL